MLFFRRRDTLRQSNLTDQERCIHACLFFAFILLILTIVLFYFAATNKGPAEQSLYYYLGAGICLILLASISLCSVVFIRRFYGSSSPMEQPLGFSSETEYTTTRSSTHN